MDHQKSNAIKLGRQGMRQTEGTTMSSPTKAPGLAGEVGSRVRQKKCTTGASGRSDGQPGRQPRHMEVPLAGKINTLTPNLYCIHRCQEAMFFVKMA